VIPRKWLAAAALSASFALGVTLPATAADKKTEFTFGALRSSSIEEAKSLSAAWLKSTGKMDQKAFDAVWAQDDLTVLDRVADTLKLGNADAAKILNESANAEKSAPKAVPALIKDAKQMASSALTWRWPSLATCRALAFTKKHWKPSKPFNQNWLSIRLPTSSTGPSPNTPSSRRTRR
jgi:hypothetical protein